MKKHDAQDPPPMPQRPIAEQIYRVTGFKESDADLDEDGYHLEFPFSDGDRHRKILMRDAYAKDLAPKASPHKSLPVPARPGSNHHSSIGITENDLFTFEDDDENNALDMDLAETSSRFLTPQSTGNVSDRKQLIEHIAPDQDPRVWTIIDGGQDSRLKDLPVHAR